MYKQRYDVDEHIAEPGHLCGGNIKYIVSMDIDSEGSDCDVAMRRDGPLCAPFSMEIEIDAGNITSENELIERFEVLIPYLSDHCVIVEPITSNDDLNNSTDKIEMTKQLLRRVSVLVQCAVKRRFCDLTRLHCFISSVFRLLAAIYKLCTDSRQLIQSLEDRMRQLLACVFRAAAEAQSLLHQLVDSGLQQLVDKCDASASGDKCGDTCQLSEAFVSVSVGIISVADRLLELDGRLMADSWQLITRLLHSWPSSCLTAAAAQLTAATTAVCSRFTSHLHALATDTEANENTVCAGSVSKRCAVMLNSCACLLKVVVGMTEQLSQLLEECSIHQLLRLTLTLYSYMVPDRQVYQVPNIVLNRINSQLTVASHPLLSALLQQSLFLSCFMQCMSGSCDEPGSLCRLRVCLAVVRRCCHLDGEMRKQWTLTAQPTLLDMVVRLLCQCVAEVVGVVMMRCDDFHDSEMSIYQVAVISVCSLFAVMSAEEFVVSERVLWRFMAPVNRHSHTDNINNNNVSNGAGDAVVGCLFASDVLCFLARYGPPELCLHYCRCLYERLWSAGRAASPPASATSSCSASWFYRLAGRLSRLLSTDHLSQLLQQLQDRPSLQLLVLIQCGCVGGGGVRQLCEAGIERQLKRQLNVTASVEQLLAWLHVLSAPSAVQGGDWWCPLVCSQLVLVWDGVARSSSSHSQLSSTHELVLLLLVQSAIQLAHCWTHDQLASILSCLRGQLPLTRCWRVQLASVRLLEKLRCRCFGDQHKNNILTNIAELHAIALCSGACDDGSVGVSRADVEALYRVARGTPHADLLRRCAAAAPGLHALLTRFIQLASSDQWSGRALLLQCPPGSSNKPASAVAGVEETQRERIRRVCDEIAACVRRVPHSSGDAGDAATLTSLTQVRQILRQLCGDIQSSDS